MVHNMGFRRFYSITLGVFICKYMHWLYCVHVLCWFRWLFVVAFVLFHAVWDIRINARMYMRLCRSP